MKPRISQMGADHEKLHLSTDFTDSHSLIYFCEVLIA